MICELAYTSAPRGLYPGSSGYCTVKATAKLPPRLRELLESLSNYRAAFPPGDPRARQNPVGVSYLSAQVGGSRWSILSRISPAPLDYSKRSNFFAHHLGFSSPAGGEIDPAWLASHSDLLKGSWDSRVEEIVDEKSLPRGREISRVCERWQATTGDAGWAGVVAQKLQDREIVYLVFEIGTQIMPLIAEVYSLLRAESRAGITFSTYYCGLPAGLDCQLRAVVAGSPEHDAAKRSSAYVIELGKCGSVTKTSLLVTLARTGKAEEPAAEIAPPSPGIGTYSSEPAEYTLGPTPPEPARNPRPGTRTQPWKQSAAVLPEQAPATPEGGGLRWGMALLGLAIGIVLGAAPIAPFWLGAVRERDELQAQLQEATSQKESISTDSQKQTTEVVGLRSKEKSLGELLQNRDGDLRKANKAKKDLGDQLAQADELVLQLQGQVQSAKSEIGKLTVARDDALTAKTNAISEKDAAISDITNMSAKIKGLESELKKAKSESVSPLSSSAKLLLPHLPDPRDSSDWKSLGKVGFAVKTLAFEGGPPKARLQPVDGKAQWELFVDDKAPVGKFLVLAPSHELRFQWTPPPGFGKEKLRSLWLQLSAAKVIASNDIKREKIDLGEEIPESLEP